MHRCWLASWAVLAACGFRPAAAPGPGGDGAVDAPGSADAPLPGDADAARDAAADAPTDATVPLGPWGTPTLVPLSTTGDDDDPTLTDDLLVLYFNRNSDIYVTTRSSVTSAWSTPARDSQLSSSSLETTPELTGDGKTIFIASDRNGGAGGEDIYVATRSSLGTAFGAPVRVSELDSSSDDAASAPTDDALAIVFISTRSGGAGNSDLYISTRAQVTDAWGTPAAIAGVNTADNEYSPFMTRDRLTLYFDSDRNGDEDLFVTNRAHATDAFGTPQPITELNTTANESDIWVSPDGHHMFFNSDRGGANALWESTR